MYATVVSTKVKGKAELVILCEDEALKGPHCGFCTAARGSKGKAPQESVLARNTCGAKRGDRVQVSLAGHAELKAALILFIIPMLIFMSALILTSSLQLPLWQSFGVSLASLIITFLMIKAGLGEKTYYVIDQVAPQPKPLRHK
ncbi:SoxR reducing system RseC family protein [Chlorobium phaeovibrioides]|uniref:SoxR reducing system RseC family protein n=1 Tax=Chlorobium phaeovibrioides TaxID=1094 RepID=A0A5M8IAD7_CHLPH|nr:SoxR reducing system RseC family protein [Chlorobium phaeovibrioides]KAA6232408.1 SoxR reducing system RseC family protein [Chlorobium phaeovibrioides]